MTGNDKIKDPFIKDYREHNDDTTVHFEVIMSEENLIMAKQEGLLKKFKLTTTISTSNMHLFDPKGVIKKYETPEQILEEFFHVRLEFYEKRKASCLMLSLRCCHYLSQGGYLVDDFMECIQG
ncbi:DNA topoisomerase 2-like [Camellia sinensis]|uniref:DNA topoisomerase 2-like n=1 Tax=Camellia sinensis TaxID=4442 RepID=UPI0010357BA2|nr:DNA topoisomerase 2-like [Camellia sinensis]